MIKELVRNQRFTFTSGNSKQSKLRRLKNGVPQGSILASSVSTFMLTTYPPDFQKVCLCRQSSIASLFWKLEGTPENFSSSNDYTLFVYF